MALSYNLIFAALAFSAVVLAHPGGRHGHGGGPRGPGRQPLPPFLQNVTSEGRKAFFDIVSNSTLTISEIESQISSWAQTYGVSDQVTEFQSNVEEQFNEIKENVTNVVNNLPTVQAQLEAIFANKTQTISEQIKAVEQLRQENPEEVGILLFLAQPKGKFPGFLGGFGGLPGSQGGFPGGNQGGFPGFESIQGGGQGGFSGGRGGSQRGQGGQGFI